MENNIKVIIVDDHKLFREVMMVVFSNSKDIEVVGEATNGNDFLDMIDTVKVNVVLMDIMMPGMNGVEAIEAALKKQPELKIIVLSMLSDKEYYDRLVSSGISGYILKDSGKEELFRAIRSVVKGEQYFSPKLIHKLISKKQGPVSEVATQNKTFVRMNMMEQSILKMICLGKTNAEISKDLSISQRTLENYKSIMINKVGVKDSLGLVIYAVKNRLVDIR